MNGQHPSRRLIAAAGGAVLVLAAACTVAVAASGGAFRSPSAAPGRQWSGPALAGTVVNVELTNMGGRMMTDGSMGGTMRVLTSRQQVSAGTVSLRVANTGSLVHELVVLPMASGQQVGQRPVGSDGKVDESASLGESSLTCGRGAGDGIAPGALGWVTLTLQPGNYELICDLPSHYTAGMYTELRVD